MYYNIYKKASAVRIWGKLIAVITLLSCIMISCKKDKLNDLEASISAKLSNSSMVSYIQKGSMITFNNVTYNYITSYVGVPVSLKSTAGTNDTISASVDTALVAAYNSLYMERNPTIPNGAFKISHNGLFAIDKGSNQAKDSLYVTLIDASKLKTNTTYLIPIQLQAKHGSELRYSVFFIKMTVTIGQLTARMDLGNVWGTATPYWNYGSMFVRYLPSSDAKGVMIGPDSVRFSVVLNTAFNPSNLKVDAVIANDDSTINAFSVKARTTYKPFPADTYELRRSSVNVLSKSLQSKDSLSVVIKNKEKFTRLTWYLMGLKIKKSPDNPLSVPSVASDSCRAYISFFVL